MTLDSRDLARRVAVAGDTEGIVAELGAADRDDVELALRSLLRDASFEVRSWALWAAPRLLGEDAVELLVRVARTSSDSDLQDIAIEELVDAFPEHARRLAKTFRRKLGSDDFYEPVTAMWALAAVGDRDAVPAIAEAAARGGSEMHRGVADVVIAILEGRGEEILERIRGHDHEAMIFLVNGARVLGTPAAAEALEECARNAPDETCRRACAESFEALARRSR